MSHTIALTCPRRLVLKLALSCALAFGALAALGAGTSHAACINGVRSYAVLGYAPSKYVQCVKNIQGMLQTIYLGEYNWTGSPVRYYLQVRPCPTCNPPIPNPSPYHLVYPGVDGYFGPQTQLAVEKLQGAWNHSPAEYNEFFPPVPELKIVAGQEGDASGVVGLKTWNAICTATWQATDFHPGGWYKEAGCLSIKGLT